ncbi:MAG: PhoH family protein [Enterococcus sp.]|nr:PhoH family protein [Enterococcus sp.]
MLDTNVILSAGKQAFTSFEDNEVVLPFVVVEELEKKRNEEGMVGAMARYALRELEKLRNNDNDDDEDDRKHRLKKGVVVNPQNGTLRIEMNHRDNSTLPEQFAKDNSNDMRVLIVANNLYLDEMAKKKNGEEYREVILLTNDLPLRIKADTAFPMRIEPYWFKGNLYAGIKTVEVEGSLIDEVYSTRGGVKAPDAVLRAADGANNHAFMVRSMYNPNHSAPILFEDGKMFKAKMDHVALKVVQGINIEQKFAMNYLFDDTKKIISLGGRAGTGKSLLAIAAAIHQVTQDAPKNKHKYNKVRVIRPIYAVGDQDLGYMPGTEEEKMAPWTKAVYQSLEGLVPSETIRLMQDEDTLEVIPATFLRGQTFHNSFTIVDEAQNFSPAVLLTILSRVGKGSKIVFLWDATQKDNANIGYNDGVISVVDKLKGYDTFAHISLNKSERSDIAEIAGNILEEYI